MGTQHSWLSSSGCREMNKISSLPCRARTGSGDEKAALFRINPLTSWTGLVEVILIFHVCGNHSTVKILMPYSLGNKLEFGATPGLVSNPQPYCVNVSHSCGSHAIIRQHPTEVFMHI